MSPDRLAARNAGRATTATSSGSQQGLNPSLKLPPKLPPQLPPLVRHRLLAAVPSPIASRSMHQLQLEMEYDAEESDNDESKGPVIHGWTGGMERHAATLCQDMENQGMEEIHALCIFDDVVVARPAQPASPCTQVLDTASPVRKWGRWRWREPPTFSDVRSIEAIMLYERGVEQQPHARCKRCLAGQGISPQCVVASAGLHGWYEPGSVGPCSNCLYDGAEHTCSASGEPAPGTPQGSEHISPSSPDPARVVDHMAVLDMIARLRRPAGATRDHSLPVRARRIEAAALEIAQAAREWGEKLSRDSR
ncbi:hypothetical protein TOPH_04089 [Tolypocladium ophioglossoides CBS 100239]|uniref:Uncharacterized protein n=1 Tax=Tolypocladium ophioglossoides (strain CBS 100239) TaxID=1163406 RepID=A0A0L0NAL2_TOLOC|nr:hypothetical protein TOPH_04089 [Tolypocladium ophioglossoides CBS 100239]